MTTWFTLPPTEGMTFSSVVSKKTAGLEIDISSGVGNDVKWKAKRVATTKEQLDREMADSAAGKAKGLAQCLSKRDKMAFRKQWYIDQRKIQAKNRAWARVMMIKNGHSAVGVNNTFGQARADKSSIWLGKARLWSGQPIPKEGTVSYTRPRIVEGEWGSNPKVGP
jgi:hypothetical protein